MTSQKLDKDSNNLQAKKCTEAVIPSFFVSKFASHFSDASQIRKIGQTQKAILYAVPTQQVGTLSLFFTLIRKAIAHNIIEVSLMGGSSFWPKFMARMHLICGTLGAIQNKP